MDPKEFSWTTAETRIHKKEGSRAHVTEFYLKYAITLIFSTLVLLSYYTSYSLVLILSCYTVYHISAQLNPVARIWGTNDQFRRKVKNGNLCFEESVFDISEGWPAQFEKVENIVLHKSIEIHFNHLGHKILHGGRHRWSEMKQASDMKRNTDRFIPSILDPEFISGLSTLRNNPHHSCLGP